MPFGQLPTLEENGKVVPQSVAITRYIAKKVKLVGNNEWEDLQIDSIVDTINDFRGSMCVLWKLERDTLIILFLEFASYFYVNDESIKEALKGPVLKDVVPYYLEKFEKITKENNGHFALGRLTWADFYFVGMHEYLCDMAGKNLFEDYPNIRKVVENVYSIPAIKTWVETRPQTEF